MREKNSLAEKVLDYWFAIEFLSQDKYPFNYEVQNRVKKLKADYARGKSKYKSIETFIQLTPQNINTSIYNIVKKEALDCGMTKWGNITFYIGMVKREQCIQEIVKTLQLDSIEKERPEKSTDSIAMISLQLSPEGKYIEKSLSLSTVLWALNEIKKEKGDLSQIIHSSSYRMTLKELADKHFDDKITLKLTDEDKPEKSKETTEKMERQLQRFVVESVTWKEIKSLYDEVFLRYIKDNIIFEDDENSVQEIYGLSFQLFADEKTKEFKEDDNYLGLSHDYFSNDIQMVLNDIQRGSLQSDGYMGKDLLEYIEILGEKENSRKRIDLVKPKEKNKFFRQLLEILCIKNAPIGKWPSRFMPALMQQVAINLAINKGTSSIFGENGKVFSVNGPPGTGKTTLLKEIVVSNIIERTILLAKYDNPDEAFIAHKFKGGTKEDHAYSSFTRRWYSLKDEEINNFSTLVTSCNNAAVENISKDLPRTMIYDLQPIDQDSLEEKEALNNVASLFDIECAQDQEETREGTKYKDIYFTKYATQLFDREDVWGLIAVPLGKKSNIKNFYYKALAPILYEFYAKSDSAKERIKKYIESRDKFIEQVAVVKQLQETLNKLHVLQQLLFQYKENYQAVCDKNGQIIDSKKKRIQNITEAIQRLDISVKEKEQKIEQLTQMLLSDNERKQEIDNELNQIDMLVQQLRDKKVQAYDKINVFTKIFKPKKYSAIVIMAEEYEKEVQEKKEDKSSLEKEVKEILQRIKQLQSDMARQKKEQDDLRLEHKKNKSTIADLQNEVVELNSQISRALEKYQQIKAMYKKEEQGTDMGSGMDSFDKLNEEYIDAVLSDDIKISTNAQVANPWLSQRYNREREKLFAYAMRMNKNFVLSSNHCRDNFITLSHYWGTRPGDDKKKIEFSFEDEDAMVPALYQTLFLLVPVISSTFASVGSLLRNVKQTGTIGMLIVDEAGQAQPQMAVGAIYRSRRAIIVGDPKQVEPVVPDDLNLLKKAYNDEDLGIYKQKNLSVQVFADRMNAIGTYLENGSDYPEWVGSPLLVHRRCISPMYDISNNLSYNGIMKLKTAPPKKELEEKFIMDKSCWINVEGIEIGNKNHFVKKQGEKVCELLEKAFSQNAEPQIYIISPFTSVVNGIKKYIKAYCRNSVATKINSDYMLDYENKRIGTVHTFQGKEADEVIFLLGCDRSDAAKGAVNWVNENIVNVAVTRAKYRLYVIGDAETWSRSSCISYAKAILDKY